MKTFLFEQYGYYPKDIKDEEFNINGWKFKLIRTDISSEYLDTIKDYIKILNDNFNNIGPFIIKNKFNGNLSSLGENNYVLVSSYDTNMNFYDLLLFHRLFYKENEYIDLDKVLKAWKNRVDKVEKELVSKLRLDSTHYKYNLDVLMFSIGLAINAMQYLSDLIYNYDNKLYGISISHKRLSNLSSFDFFNPFNFIVDNPIKDIVLLYQYDYIGGDELSSIIENYKMDVKSATYFIARLLYRVDVFDFVDTKKDLNQNDDRIKFNLEKELYKIKKAYSLLKNKYQIRPIDWLEENL